MISYMPSEDLSSGVNSQSLSRRLRKRQAEGQSTGGMLGESARCGLFFSVGTAQSLDKPVQPLSEIRCLWLLRFVYESHKALGVLAVELGAQSHFCLNDVKDIVHSETHVAV